MIDLFRCKPLASAISRTACAARYDRQIGRTCATCSVGRQHSRGALPTAWDDGAALVTADVTPATMAQLRVHLSVIESHERAPLRGMRVAGATIREHAERAGLHPQVIRQRILRGEDPATATEARHRGAGRYGSREIRYGRETLTLRGFARRLGAHVGSVGRWISQGLSPEQIAERCG